LSEEVFLEIGEIKERAIDKKDGVFDAKVCSKCGELTFVDKLVESKNGLICLSCEKNK